MPEYNKTTVGAVACQCVEPCLNCECDITTKHALVQLPWLNPLVRKHIELFITAVETAPFFSRQFNQSLPELLREALRIDREERP